jgi:hypothetical protein
MDYLPVFAILLLIGYGTYNWHRTGIRRYLWVMVLGVASIVVLEALSYIRHGWDIATNRYFACFCKCDDRYAAEYSSDRLYRDRVASLGRLLVLLGMMLRVP